MESFAISRKGRNEFRCCAFRLDNPSCLDKRRASIRPLNHTAHHIFLSKLHHLSKLRIGAARERQQLISKLRPPIAYKAQRSKEFCFRATDWVLERKQIVAYFGISDDSI